MTKNNAEKSTSENVLMSARDVQPFDLPEPLKKLGNKTTKLTGQVHMDVTYRSVSYGNAFLCLLTKAAWMFFHPDWEAPPHAGCQTSPRLSFCCYLPGTFASLSLRLTCFLYRGFFIAQETDAKQFPERNRILTAFYCVST